MMTKSIGLEKFYTKFQRQINLAASFCDKEELSTIITLCRLKPYDVIFGEYTDNLILHAHWIDEFGNSLYIEKNKSISIKLNDLSIDKSKLVNTDLYGQLSLDKVSSISKSIYFLYGRDEDTLAPHAILAFVGLDNFLRTFVLLYGEWQSYPPLFLGIETLSQIASNMNLQYYKEIKTPSRVIYPCESQRAWLSLWPSKDFVSIMATQNDSVAAIVNTTKGK